MSPKDHGGVGKIKPQKIFIFDSTAGRRIAIKTRRKIRILRDRIFKIVIVARSGGF